MLLGAPRKQKFKCPLDEVNRADASLEAVKVFIQCDYFSVSRF